MLTDYGKTFSYVLADDVPALDGSCVVTLPNINVGNINVDFKTATRSMRGGIIRVEEVGGVAYTLTTLSPENGGGFSITGGSTMIEEVHKNLYDKELYDLTGRKVNSAAQKGVYIQNGKKIYVR